MKFALVQEERVEASPGEKGTCPGCGDAVVAKCGRQKIWHWAHKGQKTCDPWWESETEWHRAWKANFPAKQQEVRHQDPETLEWHIADVKLPTGIVLEFQHSAISHEEIASREAFYKNMIWVIDATRLKKTVQKLHQAFRSGKPWSLQSHQAVTSGLENIPLEFRNSNHVVLFDAGPVEPFYCLLPGRVNDSGTMIAYVRQSVVDHLKTGDHFIDHDQTQRDLVRSLAEIAQKLNVPTTTSVDAIFELLRIRTLQEAYSKRLGIRGIFSRR